MSDTTALISEALPSVAQRCQAARDAQPQLSSASTRQKNAVLEAIAQRLIAQTPEIVAQNAADLEAGAAAGLSAATLDRLRLTPARLEGLARGVREIIALPDPVGGVEDLQRRPNGLLIGRMRIPLGVVAMIFESRPNIVVDAAAIGIKSGNAIILKGGKEAAHTNAALASLVAGALESAGLPTALVTNLTSRTDVEALLQQDRTVDLVIPRGGEGLIRYVVENSRIPVVQHFKGNCHLYVDDGADLDMAVAIAVNAKAQRPGVCNALETLLVAEREAAEFLPRAAAALTAAGVQLRGCEKTRALVPGAAEATELDWHTEYLDLILAVRVVKDMAAAIEHIRAYGSNHTEAIVTRDYARANAFIRDVGSSCVIVNASTRFNDGGELGLGAEIGISTSKLHAYGPMGLRELTTTKFVVFGDGQVRG